MASKNKGLKNRRNQMNTRVDKISRPVIVHQSDSTRRGVTEYDYKASALIKTLNFEGGGSHGWNRTGAYHVGYAFRESKLKIRVTNIKLWLMWIKWTLK